MILANAAQGSVVVLILEALAYALVLLVAGQIIPRALARRWPTQLIPVLLPPLQLVEMLLNPALRLVRRLAGAAQRAAAEPPPTDEEALEELLREGELEGVGEAGEIAIISGVVQFGEKRVRDVMMPRSDDLRAAAGPPAGRDGRVASRSRGTAGSRCTAIRSTMCLAWSTCSTCSRTRGPKCRRFDPVAFTKPATPCKELLFRHAAGTAAPRDRARRSRRHDGTR